LLEAQVQRHARPLSLVRSVVQMPLRFLVLNETVWPRATQSLMHVAVLGLVCVGPHESGDERYSISVWERQRCYHPITSVHAPQQRLSWHGLLGKAPEARMKWCLTEAQQQQLGPATMNCHFRYSYQYPADSPFLAVALLSDLAPRMSSKPTQKRAPLPTTLL
jgi:hypothetical protein